MSRARRSNQSNWNYAVLNATGERTPHQVNPILDLSAISEVDDVISPQLQNLTLNEMSKMQELIMDINVIVSEIQDVIDENPVHHELVSNFESVTSNLGTLRLDLKRKEQLVRSQDPNHSLIPTIKQALDSIKLHNQGMIECKSKAQMQARLTDRNQASLERSTCFSIEDIKYKIMDLQKEFDKPLKDLSGAELLQMKSDFPTQISQLNNISKKYESILQMPIQKAELLQDVTDIGQRYERLLKSKSVYQTSINDAIIKQDVYKQKLFNQSKLNIRLEKFSGHQDTTDFYTFKTNFLKLHEHSTPQHLLPDLLINNYLKEPALSLVKSMKDINAIWERLKFSYGDVKMMLIKKLNQISNMDSLSSTKDQEAIALSLSKLVTLLKEIINLAEQHKIEPNLYYSKRRSASWKPQSQRNHQANQIHHQRRTHDTEVPIILAHLVSQNALYATIMTDKVVT